jgi:hypothetical protein
MNTAAEHERAAIVASLRRWASDVLASADAAETDAQCVQRRVRAIVLRDAATFIELGHHCPSGRCEP